MEAEKSMSNPSCFLIRNQESNQTGKLKYFVPLVEVQNKDFWVGLGGSTLQAGCMQQRLLAGSKLPAESGHERRSPFRNILIFIQQFKFVYNN